MYCAKSLHAGARIADTESRPDSLHKSTTLSDVTLQPEFEAYYLSQWDVVQSRTLKFRMFLRPTYTTLQPLYDLIKAVLIS